MAKHGGARPNSGRPTKLESNIKKMVMEKSWAQLYMTLVDSEVPRQDKDRIAVTMASKDVPMEIEHKGEAMRPIVVVNYGTTTASS